jgi:hypothetical protein
VEIYKEKLPELKSKNFDEWDTRFPNANGTGMTGEPGWLCP